MFDVCDHKDCTAHAYVTLIFSTGVLTFCAHHAHTVGASEFAADHAEVVVVRETVPA